MLNKQTIRTSLLATGLAALLASISAPAMAGDEEKASKIYVDPVSGEVIEYRKLLSEMTEEEKAGLTDQERQKLEEIEAANNAKQGQEDPGS